MKLRVVLCILAFLVFSVGTFAARSEPLAFRAQQASPQEHQSVSGTISVVGDASFSVRVAKADRTEPVVQFLVDDKTRVEGKLEVGAKVQVEYRSDNGSNIAEHIVVTPSSGK